MKKKAYKNVYFFTSFIIIFSLISSSSISVGLNYFSVSKGQIFSILVFNNLIFLLNLLFKFGLKRLFLKAQTIWAIS